MKAVLDNVELNDIRLYELNLDDRVWLPVNLSEKFFGFTTEVFLYCYVSWISPGKHKVELECFDDIIGTRRMIVVEDNHFHPDKMHLCKVDGLFTSILPKYVYERHYFNFILIEDKDTYRRVIEEHNEAAYKLVEKLLRDGLLQRDAMRVWFKEMRAD